ERALAGRVAAGSFLWGSRRSRQPLKLAAVPRDHVAGDRQRGDALIAGRFMAGSAVLPLADLHFAGFDPAGAAAQQLQGFSWLRDLGAAASREKGARLAEAIVGR